MRQKSPTLLECNWLQQLRLKWREIHTILEALLIKKCNADFISTFGTLQVKAYIHVDQAAKPKYCKLVPYSKVEEEPNRLKPTIKRLDNSKGETMGHEKQKEI